MIRIAVEYDEATAKLAILTLAPVGTTHRTIARVLGAAAQKAGARGDGVVASGTMQELASMMRGKTFGRA